MKLTATQLAQKRKKNRESQRKSRQRVKDQIDVLQRQVRNQIPNGRLSYWQIQNTKLEQENISLQEQLRDALAAIEALEHGTISQWILPFKTEYLWPFS